MRTKKKKKSANLVLIIFCIVVLAVVVIAGIMLIRQQLSVRAYAAQIETAESYVEAGDYESAVTAYNEAIEMNPQKESAYVDLAYLYLDLGDEESAVETLERGEENAATIEEILYILAAIDDGTLAVYGTVDTETKTTLQTSYDGDFGYDTALIQRLEDYTYENYKDAYGMNASVTKVSSDEVTVVHPNLAATFTYANTDSADNIVSNGTPADDAQPSSVTFDDLSVLFSNFDGTATQSELQTLSTTKVTPKTSGSMTYVVLSYMSLQIQIETDEDGNLTAADAWNEITMTEANEDRTNTGTYAGVIVDATTGEGVTGATVSFVGQETKNKVSDTTDSSGAFEVELEPDTYDVTISAEDFIDETFEVEVESGKKYSGEQYTISPTLSSGTVRIVLEWDAEPADLDLYLLGYTDDGDRVAASYKNKTVTDSDGNVIAELDVDDRNGYGPETITLYELSGEYTCSVVDFENYGTLSVYGATVKVYLPNESTPVTIELDKNAGVNILWDVFELNDGELEILNEAGDESRMGTGSKS